jgi:hypothetical protein
MASQVAVLAPPRKPLSTVLTKDQPAPWRSPNSQDPSSIPERFENHGSLPTINPSEQAFDISAQSVQFVASPGQTRKLQSVLPDAIRNAFRLVPAFAGCMVMVSDQEARRVTIVTLWKGKERARHCSENVEQMRMLLFPYVDHWLRSENHVAHFSTSSPVENTANSRSTVNA